MVLVSPKARVCPCGGVQLGPPLFETAYADARFTIRVCLACGRKLLDPPPSAETLARAYSQEYYGAKSETKFIGPIEAGIDWFRQGRARRAESLVRNSEPPVGRPRRILDIGCGNGRFLSNLQARGWECHGSELSEESAGRARRIPGLQIRVGALDSDSFPPEFFDVVSIWHVLEHLPDPDSTLANCARWLVPGGALLAAVPNAASWQARIFRGAWFHLDPPRHLFHFTPESLEFCLRAAGFRLESMRHLSLEQNPFGYLQSFLNRLGFPRDDLYEVLKGTRRFSSWGRAIAELATAGLVSVPALAFSVLEAAFRQGGTVDLVARKVRASDARHLAPAGQERPA